MRYDVSLSPRGLLFYLTWLANTWDGLTIGSPNEVYEFMTAPEREAPFTFTTR